MVRKTLFMHAEGSPVKPAEKESGRDPEEEEEEDDNED
jgi:hypothetical protein